MVKIDPKRTPAKSKETRRSDPTLVEPTRRGPTSHSSHGWGLKTRRKTVHLFAVTRDKRGKIFCRLGYAIMNPPISCKP
ncbi:hypothetical protein V6N11_028057 [Hibiscus sabdariffa]|uniref:Uncharacterized protein n=1 Tax=Hibiscus sabdariffa TaxID=183260 RepID=A0ABR2P048_9ROSI